MRREKPCGESDVGENPSEWDQATQILRRNAQASLGRKPIVLNGQERPWGEAGEKVRDHVDTCVPLAAHDFLKNLNLHAKRIIWTVLLRLERREADMEVGEERPLRSECSETL